MSERFSYRKGDWIEFTHRTKEAWMTGRIEKEETMYGFDHPFFRVSCYLGPRFVGDSLVSERNYRIRPSEKRFTFDNLFSAFSEEA